MQILPQLLELLPELLVPTLDTLAAEVKQVAAQNARH
jgi:hypothetical protein